MMAWIKIEHALPRKPEVMQLAAIMGIDEMAVVGHLVCFWSWVDLNLSLDCPVARGTESGLDRVAGRDGFVRAMVEVGWLNPHPEGGYLVPDYDGHLSKSAKQRALDWKKKQRHRSLSRNCPPECPDERGTNEGQSGGQNRPHKSKSKSKNNKKTYVFSSEDMDFAQEMFKGVTEIQPNNFKLPSIESWANDVRLMREQDHRSFDDICRVWAWAHHDPFWSSNILSPKKLRDKFDQLMVKMAQPTLPGLKSDPKDDQRRMMEMLDEIYPDPPSEGDSDEQQRDV